MHVEEVNLLATTEGWYLSNRDAFGLDAPCVISSISRRYSVQSLVKFANDDDALRHVMTRAVIGNAQHIEALDYVRATNPAEWVRIGRLSPGLMPIIEDKMIEYGEMYYGG
jgi:hypothetical protein